MRDARDADELLALAQRSRRLGREAEAARRLGEAAVREAELADYLDKALRACRRASHALARVVTLLPPGSLPVPPEAMLGVAAPAVFFTVYFSLHRMKKNLFGDTGLGH